MSLCYWFAEACANGHIIDCPLADGHDPWAECTAEHRVVAVDQESGTVTVSTAHRAPTSIFHSWGLSPSGLIRCTVCTTYRTTVNAASICPGMAV